VSAREELLTLTVAQARRVPILAAAFDEASRDARLVGCKKIVPCDDSATLADVVRWARGNFAACVLAEPRTEQRAASLHNLVAVLGEDVTELWFGLRAEARRGEVLEAVAAEHLRHVREGGAA
jgi:hypothetical protein